MEVEVVRVVQEVSGHMVYKYVSLPFLGRMFELLVIVVDDLRYSVLLEYHFYKV